MADRIKKKGPVYIALAALFWSFGGVGTKYIPWSALSIVCIRGFFSALTVGCLRRSFKIKFTPTTVAAAIAMCSTVVLFVTANKMTTAANAIVFQYTAPVYVILISIIGLKKRPEIAEVVTVLLTFAGISLFFIDELGGGSLAGDLLALLSGAAYAIMTIINCLPSSDPESATLLGSFLTVLFLPTVFLDSAVFSSGLTPWVVVILLGVFQLGLPYYLFSKGLQETGAIAASIITTAEPVLNPIWVFLVIGELPGWISIAGAALVIASICFYNVFTAKQNAKEKTPELADTDHIVKQD